MHTGGAPRWTVPVSDLTGRGYEDKVMKKTKLDPHHSPTSRQIGAFELSVDLDRQPVKLFEKRCHMTLLLFGNSSRSFTLYPLKVLALFYGYIV